jgi:hypothetical protein
MIYLYMYKFFILGKVSQIKYIVLRYIYKKVYRLLLFVESGLESIFLS